MEDDVPFPLDCQVVAAGNRACAVGGGHGAAAHVPFGRVPNGSDLWLQADRRDCQPEPGYGCNGLAGTIHAFRLWTETLPVGLAS
jgi:hypothetical protein